MSKPPRTAVEEIVLIGEIAHRLRQLDPDKIVPWTYESLKKYEDWAEAALGVPSGKQEGV